MALPGAVTAVSGPARDPWAGTLAPGPPLVPPSAPEAAFRDTMARLAGGVAVVSTLDAVGRDCGITVTAASSVSLDPPLVLVCVRRGSFMHDALTVADGWALSMLADDQVELARYAARHRAPGDRDDFSRWAHRRGEASGALVLTGGVAAVECLPYDVVDAGDHAVCIGRVVVAADDTAGERPLVYVDRAYTSLGGTPG